MTAKPCSPGYFGGGLWHHHALTSSIYPITPHNPLSPKDLYEECRCHGGNMQDCAFGSYRHASEFYDNSPHHRNRLFSHTESGSHMRLLRLIRWLYRHGHLQGRLMEMLLSGRHRGEGRGGLLEKLLNRDGGSRRLLELLSGRGGGSRRLLGLLSGRCGSSRRLLNLLSRGGSSRRLLDLLSRGGSSRRLLNLLSRGGSSRRLLSLLSRGGSSRRLRDLLGGGRRGRFRGNGLLDSIDFSQVTNILTQLCARQPIQVVSAPEVMVSNMPVGNCGTTASRPLVGFRVNNSTVNGASSFQQPGVGPYAPAFQTCSCSASAPQFTSQLTTSLDATTITNLSQLLGILLNLTRRGTNGNHTELTLLQLLARHLHPNLTINFDGSNTHQLYGFFLELIQRLALGRGGFSSMDSTRWLLSQLYGIVTGNNSLDLANLFSGADTLDVSTDDDGDLDGTSEDDDDDDDDDGDGDGLDLGLLGGGDCGCDGGNRNLGRRFLGGGDDCGCDGGSRGLGLGRVDGWGGHDFAAVLEDLLLGSHGHRHDHGHLEGQLLHGEDADNDYFHDHFRPRWGHAHEEEEHYADGADDDEPSPLAIKDASRHGVCREVAKIHGEHNHTYPHPKDLYCGFMNHPDHLNGFTDSPTGRDYDHIQGGGHGGHAQRYYRNHFLVTIENSHGHPYESKIPVLSAGSYCLEMNGIKGRPIYLQRGQRYEFTFKIFDRCGDVLGENFDVTSALSEKFMLTADNTGGPGAVPFEWAPQPINVGTSIWVEVPASAPPMGFYQLSQTPNCGFWIIFYGGEMYKHY